MKRKVRTVDVIAKEWFDRINGNSYFSMHITINFGMPGEQSFFVPMKYGYGDHYRHMAFNELQKRGFLPTAPERVSYWQYYKDHNIIARHTKHENCLKREILNPFA